ncbi:hypothetical protein [Moorena sp. SIO3H5]|uniref:hypothetical protein n=1 Tax=Moorena sp. SIO3H5 TaxID=2607834 RepID=UPI0013BBA318|nr:hypothetical protein [Moorena sp. SIO3H5]NEO70471.1 hypothetical protein [Moorena sp. SIO3H5]
MGLAQSNWTKSDVPKEHRFFYSYAIANFKPDRSLCGWYGATRNGIGKRQEARGKGTLSVLRIRRC